MFDVRRREFITLLGSASMAWPMAARAQQPGKLATIGCLVPGTPSSHGQWFAAFVQRLRELGWIEGRTVAVEYRWADNQQDRLPGLAADLVRRQVAASRGRRSGGAAGKAATATTPIVFVIGPTRSEFGGNPHPKE